LIIDGREQRCSGYSSSGTGISEFFLMWINDGCCLRSSEQSNTECPKKDGDCNPSESNTLGMDKVCEDNDCAHPVWADGCKACMCFNNGNAAWCDGFQGDYYDTYFDQHGENPWGDTNVKNRKCNPEFKPYYTFCYENWHCALGLRCVTDSLVQNHMCVFN
jgi:hypothetical protein